MRWRKGVSGERRGKEGGGGTGAEEAGGTRKRGGRDASAANDTTCIALNSHAAIPLLALICLLNVAFGSRSDGMEEFLKTFEGYAGFEGPTCTVTPPACLPSRLVSNGVRCVGPGR